MPQIEIPFTPGQRVRTKDGYEFEVTKCHFGEAPDGTLEWSFGELWNKWFSASTLTLVEPVIEWRRGAVGWSSDNGWWAGDDGLLLWKTHRIGFCDNPRAIAEATQKMWNEARKG